MVVEGGSAKITAAHHGTRNGMFAMVAILLLLLLLLLSLLWVERFVVVEHVGLDLSRRIAQGCLGHAVRIVLCVQSLFVVFPIIIFAKPIITRRPSRMLPGQVSSGLSRRKRRNGLEIFSECVLSTILLVASLLVATTVTTIVIPAIIKILRCSNAIPTFLYVCTNNRKSTRN